MKIDLSERVAVVTGASRGIGRAIALKLAQAGASVVVNYQAAEEAADQVVGAITSGGGQAFAVAADVSHAEDAERLLQTAVSAYGKVDILINNAGINRDNLIMRMSEADWDEVMRIDLKGAFLCTKTALRTMVRQRYGRIINISSVVGLAGNAGQANYAAAKAGLIGLTKTIAREVASRGITANAIAPGFIETEMTQRLSEEVRRQALAQIPLGCWGRPEDVAAVATFLASAEAGYITGQVVSVDGGMVMA